MSNHLAKVSITIDAPASDVWQALTDPDKIKVYQFGSDVVTDWQVGSPIIYRGEWQGKPFEDKGSVIAVEPNSRLQITHYSPLSGAPDTPENYHTLTYTLAERDSTTTVDLIQDNNASEDEAKHSTEMWNTVLEGMKKVVEG